jgi:hypothetical protein
MKRWYWLICNAKEQVVDAVGGVIIAGVHVTARRRKREVT